MTNRVNFNYQKIRNELFIIHARVWHRDVTVKQCRHCHLNLSGFHENTQNVEWHMSLKLPLFQENNKRMTEAFRIQC